MPTRISYQALPRPEHSCYVIIKDPHERIQARWLNGRFYETQRHGMLNTVYRRFQGGTFIDVGAAIGNHTLFFATCCAADKVYSFEPVETLYAHLQENVRANDLTTVHAYNLALGNRAAEVGMQPSTVPPATGGMLMSKVDESGTGVQMARLDDLLADEDVGEVRCIKIDVEGYNLPVLEGAAATIRHYHPAIFCECECAGEFAAVNAYLQSLDYKVWQVDGRPFVMNHTPTYLWEWSPTVDFAIAITTYNRPAALTQMLQSLMADAGHYKVHCRIYNDGSTVEYPTLPASSDTFQISYHPLARNYGKRDYWQLINRIWQDQRMTPATYYMQLPDDVEALPGFFTHAAATYQAINDPKKIALNLYLDDARIGKPCWTPHLPQICRFGTTTVFKTGWMDMIYMAEAHFFEQLGHAINPILAHRWDRKPRLSSGVGQQISKRLRRSSFYQVRQCYLRSIDVPSLMHPDRPAHENLATVQLDPIICGVASIPGRVASLQGVVTAVLPSVDALHVYLNHYGKVPAFLCHPKIHVHRSQDHGDLGDAGKFFTVGQTEGYYLAIDDDIRYPDDYVWMLINALRARRKTGQRVAVGLHAKIMRGEVRHYYRDHLRSFHFRKALAQAEGVHVLGTNTLAFHTADLPITIADFAGARNAADIHFSIACQKHNVGCLALPRANGYLQSLPHDSRQTIWGHYRSNDQIPTDLYNSWRAWKIRA